MSEKIGQMTLKKKSLSPETERIMEQEIKSLLDVRHQISNHEFFLIWSNSLYTMTSCRKHMRTRRTCCLHMRKNCISLRKHWKSMKRWAKRKSLQFWLARSCPICSTNSTHTRQNPIQTRGTGYLWSNRNLLPCRPNESSSLGLLHCDYWLKKFVYFCIMSQKNTYPILL